MLLWVVMALMTGAAVMAVLWPLSRRGPVPVSTNSGDVEFYRDQMAEIDREAERGLISPEEARAARTEAGRRLLRATGDAPHATGSTGEPALRRRRAAAAFSLSLVPLIGLAIYGMLGSPQIPSRSVAARPEPAEDIVGAIAQIEKHLAAHPDDGRGWDVVAPVYLRVGRYDDAVRAYATARRLQGESAARLTGQGEALVAAAGGVVSAEAGQIFSRAIELDPSAVTARFYRALSAEQDGDHARAKTEYALLVADAPPGAPWRHAVESRLARLDGTPPPAPAAPQGVPPEIAAMVEGLDTRLARDGGTEAEWGRLVRSFVVLGRPEDARDRLSRARVALAKDASALAKLDRLAEELGLRSREAAR